MFGGIYFPKRIYVIGYRLNPDKGMTRIHSDFSFGIYSPDGMICGWGNQSIYLRHDTEPPAQTKPRRISPRFLSSPYFVMPEEAED